MLLVFLFLIKILARTNLFKICFNFFLVVGTLQQQNVCFGAKDDQFGNFTIKNDGRLLAVVLVHQSGYVDCSGVGPSNWGCGGDEISVVITDRDDNRIFPRHISGPEAYYSLPGYSSNSKSIHLNDSEVSLFVKQGINMIIMKNMHLNDPEVSLFVKQGINMIIMKNINNNEISSKITIEKRFVAIEHQISSR